MLSDTNATADQLKPFVPVKLETKFRKLAFKIVECHRVEMPTSISLAKVNQPAQIVAVIDNFNENNARK